MGAFSRFLSVPIGRLQILDHYDWMICSPMRTRSLLPARFVWTPGSLTSDNGSPKYNSLITWLKSYLSGFYWFKFDPQRSPEHFLRPKPDLNQETLNRFLVETEWVEIWKFPGTLFTLNCPPNLQPRFSFIGSRI